MALLFREAAIDDLDAILDFSFSRFGADIAFEYREGLDRAFGLIEDNPEIGMVTDLVEHDVRSITFRSHRIYYQRDGADIVVIRVLHHAQDHGARLRS
ncbi:type II toxin-antitoxin system RelE/ParE family toxin [Novosphingopyxis sp. YJ-S2-01]|uniref:type II toxin-antitoxin system RelE/ParE family toxin n=1 Tax=Novosphingopyxis sp. YJ-S2-01 TaxID=2794021 RepID=UPI0018DB2E85|nr:type II toxin-antitoxin system RelE/ParE family toxin [Novosphingopyxis sp. YJ-S2-01]MBH9536107.1 type II toxin-antitoxin system RelE/ParE family toxin [Novosphingopyxis sp. YJ-S2-01]